MPEIKLNTKIHAPIETVFDLARNIDLHVISAGSSDESAIEGKTSGLINLGESVTWRARHFGVWRTLTSKITEFDSPHYFVDEMVKGAFKSFRHEHHFSTIEQGTQMTDIFEYTPPYGILGTAFDYLFLMDYILKFLYKRNQVIKSYAESKNKRSFIPNL